MFNAIDALPNGGTIRLVAEQQGDRVVTTVADSGLGIPPEALRHVFEPYFTTKGARGTGLGLAIVRTIAQLHRGTVEISSEIGRGTLVRLTFPLSAAAIPATADLSAQHVHAHA